MDFYELTKHEDNSRITVVCDSNYIMHMYCIYDSLQNILLEKSFTYDKRGYLRQIESRGNGIKKVKIFNTNGYQIGEFLDTLSLCELSKWQIEPDGKILSKIKLTVDYYKVKDNLNVLYNYYRKDGKYEHAVIEDHKKINDQQFKNYLTYTTAIKELYVKNIYNEIPKTIYELYKSLVLDLDNGLGKSNIWNCYNFMPIENPNTLMDWINGKINEI